MKKIISKINKYKNYIIIGFVGVIIIIIFFPYNSNDNELELERPTNVLINNRIVVEIIGEVYYPGIYEINENIRLYELVILAGGYKKDADIDNINQVRLIYDSEKIIINRKGTNLISVNNGKININTATISQLTTLPGIGEARANSIITYRNDFGPFVKIDDIMKISGISSAIFENIKDFICI